MTGSVGTKYSIPLSYCPDTYSRRLRSEDILFFYDHIFGSRFPSIEWDFCAPVPWHWPDIEILPSVITIKRPNPTQYSVDTNIQFTPSSIPDVTRNKGRTLYFVNKSIPSAQTFSSLTPSSIPDVIPKKGRTLYFVNKRTPLAQTFSWLPSSIPDLAHR